jgi:hypothetical protein
MKLKTVETRGTNFYFKCCNDKKLAIGTEAKCAIEQLPDSSAIPRAASHEPSVPPTLGSFLLDYRQTIDFF